MTRALFLESFFLHFGGFRRESEMYCGNFWDQFVGNKATWADCCVFVAFDWIGLNSAQV